MKPIFFHSLQNNSLIYSPLWRLTGGTSRPSAFSPQPVLSAYDANHSVIAFFHRRLVMLSAASGPGTTSPTNRHSHPRACQAPHHPSRKNPPAPSERLAHFRIQATRLPRDIMSCRRSAKCAALVSRRRGSRVYE